jgi:hypothetical protein
MWAIDARTGCPCYRGPMSKTSLAILLGAAAMCSIACDKDAPPPPPPGPAATAPSLQQATPTQGLLALDSAVPSSTRATAKVPTSPPKDPGLAIFLGYEAPTDPIWRWEPPRNQMRLMNWVIPSPPGAEPAELTITHFPEAAGNTREANIRRWASQFRGDDLAPQPEVTSLTVSDMPVTMVELQGEYLGMGGGWHKADYIMLVAMVESPKGSIFIKMLGSTQTVNAARPAFMAMVEGLRPTKAL